jgi:hypothetical protein
MEKNIKEYLKNILGESALEYGNMTVSKNVTKLAKTIYYLEGQLPFGGLYVSDEDKEYFREHVKSVLKHAAEILSGVEDVESVVVDNRTPEEIATTFSNDKLKVPGGLLSEDYKTGYKEGIEHYVKSINKNENE